MILQPIENFIFEGILGRVQQVFGCKVVFTTANDKTKTLARLREGSELQYPYIFLVLNNYSRNKESYVSRYLPRRGLMAVVGEEQGQTVRLLPTNFDLEVEFVTNKFQGIEQGTVTAFAKRWLFAADCGYLKFNVMYGRLQLPISVTLGDAVPIPPLENKVEVESAYKITTSLTVHGYVSESVLGSQGIVNTLAVDEVMANSDGSIPGHQFIPF